jgi:hypothetical protein
LTKVRNFIRDKKFFGGNKSLFIFCKEAMIPAVDLDGKIIMESTYQIATSNFKSPASIFEAICNNEKV